MNCSLPNVHPSQNRKAFSSHHLLTQPSLSFPSQHPSHPLAHLPTAHTTLTPVRLKGKVVAVESSEAQAPLCELQQTFGEAELWLAEVGVREGEEASRSSQSKFRSGHVGESR